MNTKNSTSFLFKILAVVLAAISCNAIQMVTGEKTKLGKFGKDGPRPYYVFFDSGSPHYLNTYDGFIGSLNAGTSGSSFTPFDGSIFYSASDGTSFELFRYDHQNATAAAVTMTLSSTKVPVVEHDGKLFYANLTSGELCYLTGANSATACVAGSANEFFYTHWFLSNPYDNNLYACIGMSSNEKLYVVDVNSGIPNMVVPDSQTDMPCGPERPIFQNGKFVSLSMTSLSVYDSSNNIRADISNSLATGDFMGISGQGNVLIADNGDLYTLSLSDHSFNMRASGISPAGNVIEAPDAVLYTAYDAGTSGYQVFRMPKWDPAQTEMITSFANGYIGMYLAVGQGSLYFFHQTGVERISFDQAQSYNIFPQTVSNPFEEIPYL